MATKVTNLSFSELNSLADSVVVKYNIEVKNAVQDVAGMKIFSLPWTDVNSLNIVSAETRKYPFQYWSYQTEDHTTEIITIELPEGKKLAEVPKDIMYECANALYRLTFDTKTPGKVFVTHYFEKLKDELSIEEYAAFKKFINDVSEADNKQYALK